jgi:hypothetical protein
MTRQAAATNEETLGRRHQPSRQDEAFSQDHSHTPENQEGIVVDPFD